MGVNNMDRMIATRRLWESEAPRSSAPDAAFKSTNENSPTWHSVAADRIPTRSGSRKSRAVPVNAK